MEKKAQKKTTTKPAPKREKMAFVINGRGGVGKDTLIHALAREGHRVMNVSSSDIVKQSALAAGWNGEKDVKGRQFLVAIKEAMVEYGDLPTVYLTAKYNEFMASEFDFYFAHVREPREIEKLVKKINAKTILVKRAAAPVINTPNENNVDKYKYDIIFHNDQPIEKSVKDFFIAITQA